MKGRLREKGQVLSQVAPGDWMSVGSCEQDDDGPRLPSDR